MMALKERIKRIKELRDAYEKVSDHYVRDLSPEEYAGFAIACNVGPHVARQGATYPNGDEKSETIQKASKILAELYVEED